MDLLNPAWRGAAAVLPASIATLLLGSAAGGAAAAATGAVPADSLQAAADTLAAAAPQDASGWAVWPWVLAALAGALLLHRIRR